MVTLKDIEKAAENTNGTAKNTPLQFSKRLSDVYKANIYLKREDLQEVRSFKIRGALNKMMSLKEEEKKNGVVTASAGNHAQGVAFSCKKLKVHGVIFMPVVAPAQKVERVKYFGDGYVQVKLEGESYDEAVAAAKKYSHETGATYVPAFEDEKVIAGQGVIGLEILEKLPEVDAVLIQIGGGGLIAGVSSAIKTKKPGATIYGVEPTGAASMDQSLKNNEVSPLKTVDTFCDGVAVKTVGRMTLDAVKKYVKKIAVVPEGQVATTMIDLYQNDGIVAEPSGALTVSALENLKQEIKSKNVVCVISGGNNDILKYPEIQERSLIYLGRKHYFLVEFAQKPGQLKKFLNHVLGPHDDIVLFEYIKKTNKEKGPALVGIEFTKKEDYQPMVDKMNNYGFNFKEVKSTDLSYNLLVG